MKRRIRIYSPFLPFPADEGAFHVILDQARTLSSGDVDVELVVWKDGAAQISRKLRSSSFPAFPVDVRITCLTAEGPVTRAADEWRELTAAASHVRESRAERIWRIIRSAASGSPSPERFHYPPGVRRMSALPPADLGIYHYSFAHPWLGDPGPERRRVVHLHNLESELAAFRMSGGGGLGRIADSLHRQNARRLAAHEAELSRLTDELWFVSARDLDRYTRRYGRAPVRLVPPTFPRELWESRSAGFRPAPERAVCAGFLGKYDFAPNRASLEWIVDRLAPELERASFDGKLLIAGRGIPDDVRARGDRYGFFEWLGFVPELDEFWDRLSFVLIPHVGGSGVRVKLLDALLSGVPVLANADAVAALPPDLLSSPLLSVSESPGDWAGRLAGERAPFETRASVEPIDFDASSLSGAVVYRFLLASEDSPATL